MRNLKLLTIAYISAVKAGVFCAGFRIYRWDSAPVIRALRPSESARLSWHRR